MRSMTTHGDMLQRFWVYVRCGDLVRWGRCIVSGGDGWFVRRHDGVLLERVYWIACVCGWASMTDQCERSLSMLLSSRMRSTRVDLCWMILPNILTHEVFPISTLSYLFDRKITQYVDVHSPRSWRASFPITR